MNAVSSLQLIGKRCLMFYKCLHLVLYVLTCQHIGHSQGEISWLFQSKIMNLQISFNWTFVEWSVNTAHAPRSWEDNVKWPNVVYTLKSQMMMICSWRLCLWMPYLDTVNPTVASKTFHETSQTHEMPRSVTPEPCRTGRKGIELLHPVLLLLSGGYLMRLHKKCHHMV